jgi:hypothetical protein
MFNIKIQNETVAQKNQRANVSVTICIVQLVSQWVAPFLTKWYNGKHFQAPNQWLKCITFSKDTY